MISVKELTKFYGEKLAIHHVSFEVQKGEIVGLLGPNGAGKTTTMRIITAFMPPSSGDAFIAGYSIWEHEEEIKKRIGYLPENPPLYHEMTVESYLDFVADLKGIDKSKKPVQIEDVIEKVSLGDVRKRLIGVLSKGYRQRVGLAQALLGNPEVLILDEPTVGLDPKQIIEIRSLIKNLSGDHTVILSTHILPEVEMTCDRVVIINEGKVVAQDTVDNLTLRLQGTVKINLEVKGETTVIDSVLSKFDDIVNIEKMETNSDTLKISLDCKNDIRKDLAKALVSNSIDLIELTKDKLSLEEAFLHLTTKEEEVQV